MTYNGPAPETYPRPLPGPEPVLQAPEMIRFYVKDPEPVPVADPPRPRAAGASPAKTQKR